MSRKSRWFLGAACAAMIVAFGRFLPGEPMGAGVTDFSTGLAAALMVGVLVAWKGKSVHEGA